jgi:hypothetical protein
LASPPASIGRVATSPVSIVEALARLRARSCIVDGEAVCCDEDRRAELRPHPVPAARRQRVQQPNGTGRDKVILTPTMVVHRI